jgi:hypothetical protein
LKKAIAPKNRLSYSLTVFKQDIDAQIRDKTSIQNRYLSRSRPRWSRPAFICCDIASETWGRTAVVRSSDPRSIHDVAFSTRTCPQRQGLCRCHTLWPSPPKGAIRGAVRDFRRHRSGSCRNPRMGFALCPAPRTGRVSSRRAFSMRDLPRTREKTVSNTQSWTGSFTVDSRGHPDRFFGLKRPQIWHFSWPLIDRAQNFFTTLLIVLPSPPSPTGRVFYQKRRF